ncbi:MAG: SRPBCC family protein [Bryobacteraceae bacterium]
MRAFGVGPASVSGLSTALDRMAGVQHVVSASANIPAPPERVYGLIADYRNGHSRILPKQFSGLTVEKGGIGAGTVIRFQMRLMGKTRTYRGAVTEPEPGRVLVEAYSEPNHSVTTFRVDPGSGPGESHVTISTQLAVQDGLPGRIERWLITRMLNPIYLKELEILARVAEEDIPK